MIATAPLAQPSVIDAPRRLVAFKHCTCTHDELKDTLGAAFAQIYARIAESGVATAGPPFVVYNDQSVPERTWDIDVCAPVAEEISPTPDVNFRVFPSEKAVEIFHTGPYRTLGAAYEAINRYVTDHGLVRNGPPREIYLSEPDVPSEQIQTVIEQPIS